MIARTVLALALAVAAVDPAAVAETEKFRATHEADFRRDFVTLAGLFSLKDGGNTIGSAVSSGCFRLVNGDVIDLFSHVSMGTTVIVLPPGRSV